jgi:hypothetical protein
MYAYYQMIATGRYRGRSEQPTKEDMIASELERIAAAVDRARTGHEARTKTTGSRGTIVILPRRFKCTECGCEVYRKFYNVTECAWCAGRGRVIR